ncbi:MAG TPA: tRNA (adenosine(37)-N6)-threonylcarbamoyltransferase complex dimerization subunit type 1 TsaB [Bacteroidales bacterium]|jgi:tRNA threonylcarbamoyladenosine biosynthesis protein TsaB|nr:tRNA (adenosine(37)-N6)-threonylcarbamoyltransferase complex dimerization subunit type 1 TsaB [Bacteroidales bacterium]
MSRILLLDTATDICTVSLFEGDKCIAMHESGEDRSHAVQLAVYVEEVLKESGFRVSDLNAIAVSKGPGSYTGLRIGVSTAKGLCYAANVPLISVSTLQAMCSGVNKEYLTANNLHDFYFCPMLDARRMEVYTAFYRSDYTKHRDISAEIIDDASFVDLLNEKPVVFFGNGAEKTKAHIKHKNAFYFDAYKHSSTYMLTQATRKLEEKIFEDVAYFEPFYLKDFVATIPRKNILGR